MAEQFREDPTKKETKVEADKQAAPDAAMSPEAEARRKLFGQKSTANESLQLLFKAYNGMPVEKMTNHDAQDPLVSSETIDEWGEHIKKALTEKKGSRRLENPDLVVPLLLLAEKAFKRNDPSATPDAESKRFRETALNTVQVLFERYPDKLDPNALNSGKFDRLLKTAGEELKRAGGVGDIFADTLTNIGEDIGKEDPYRLIYQLDGTIESLTGGLVNDAYDDSRAGAGGKDVQESHRSEAAKILPQLKALTHIRKAMSQRLLGREFSPDDVSKIVLAKDELEKITAPEQVRESGQATASTGAKVETESRPIASRKSEETPQTPERQVRTFNDVKRELNAATTKSIAEQKALVTPEVKQAVMQEVLRMLDNKIKSGKELGGRVGAKRIVDTLGWNAGENVYKYPYMVGAGKELNSGVTVVDYMQRTFDYDLRNDQKRVAELKQWTDALD